ncbi:RseA family anti-sigma factor [uncultured Salinisphaera sp.]|uniref:sigma-E factor negative regulatory protein n=1 Tax=uncultured Salinisphaera sp. TaxID=359372 RepID=UPI0032B1D84F
MNEQFSAFLDGEATRDEADAVVSALLRDEQLRESWGRQHWLRTTLRAHNGEMAVPLDCNFSDRVMAAIAQDRPETAAARPVAVPMRVAARRRWRSMAGLAAVASAAGIVLLVSNPLRQDATTGNSLASASGNGAPAATSVAAQGNAAGMGGAQAMVASNELSSDMLRQAGPSQAAVQRGPADHWSVSDPALEDELNGYLVEHNGLARGYGMSGTTPGFVRVATYGQDTPQ